MCVPKISVIIPCFNSAEFLRRAVDSVYVQSMPDWELILVDNNSTDSTPDLISELAAEDQRIKFKHQPKRGASAARNLGLATARGSWIQFLDSDDELLPGKFERQLGVAEMERSSVIVGTYYRAYPNGKRELVTPLRGNPWISLVRTRLGITSANMWSASAVRGVSGWDESLSSSQDADLQFRLLAAGNRVAFDTSVSAVIHKQPRSISVAADDSSRIRIIENFLSVRKHIAEHLSTEGLYSQDMRRSNESWVYEYLIGQKLFLPDFVEERLKQLDLSPSLFSRSRAHVKYLLKSAFSSLRWSTNN